ncbi:MAG: SET domain-containing protein-lysine N-methyltransferase [Chlamydiota bacterium]|nr:SET domain-containing protein-lysine N-methyltransferase [Chlamydiota bacterium]
MFSLFNKANNPLHQAVINDDQNSVRDLMQKSDLLLERNALGFSALELAKFLHREKILKLLDPHHHPKIQIQFPDESEIKVISAEEFYSDFEIRYVQYPHFSSYGELKSTIKNLPLSLKYRFLASSQYQLARLYQSELESGYIADLTVRWIDNTLGYGVFTSEALNEGAFIGEYTGRVRRICRFNPDPNAYCFQYPTKLWSMNYTVVDALHEGNILRFVNHSDLPNLSPTCVVDRGLVRIVFVANRDIKEGEQLTFNYGEDYWKNRTKKQLS